MLYGDVMSAAKTMHTFQNVWRQYGFVPEVLNLQTGAIVNRLHGYFLRPEMVESTMYLYQATRDPVWTAVGTNFSRSKHVQHYYFSFWEGSKELFTIAVNFEMVL